MILLGLLVGDVVVGGIWLIRYNGISRDLHSDMTAKFAADYRKEDSDFRQLWDDLQRGSGCCGVGGPLDYNISRWQDHVYSVSADTANFSKEKDVLLPWTCCVPEKQGLFARPAMANTIKERLNAKMQEEEEEAARMEAEAERKAAEDAARRRIAMDDPYAPEVMVLEGPIIEPNAWCR